MFLLEYTAARGVRIVAHERLQHEALKTAHTVKELQANPKTKLCARDTADIHLLQASVSYFLGYFNGAASNSVSNAWMIKKNEPESM
jgi:hypothetical protein